ncbi:hypothetical protein C9374_000044 [Naegleria lovaniensis]|uniref:Uncharacterized protein n=1 Tax=Naegleria lovaniensis TaxID=51637 RepID=A0AA88GX31_NAELO|nr:uncharacterized protein C9374_000044 [Naegleria lovaniensis]KAG2388605.1 hypothetical protein C9374_000044 [Naegleria lovaniensis]
MLGRDFNQHSSNLHFSQIRGWSSSLNRSRLLLVVCAGLIFIAFTLIMIQLAFKHKRQLSSSIGTLQDSLREEETKTTTSSSSTKSASSERIKSEIHIKQTREFSSREILHSQQQATKRSNFVWSRYVPPKIPNSFSKFETPLIRHDMVDSSVKNDFFKKSKSVNSGTSKSSTSIGGAQLFKSDFKCIRLRPDSDFARDPQFLYSSCRFENVCMSRKGNWFLFKNVFNRDELNGKIWLSTSATKKHEFNPAKMRMFLKSPPKEWIISQQPTVDEQQEPQDLEKKDTDENSNTDQILKISKDFKWFSTPVFGFSRHSSGNAGHLILDNYLTLFNLMLDFEYVNTNMGILFFDDIFNEETGIHARANMDGNLAESNSLIWAKYFSRYTPLQLCKDRVEGYSIGQAPCRQEVSSSSMRPNAQQQPGNTVKSLSRQGQELAQNDEMVACFSSLVMGTPDSYLFDLYRREAILPLFRNYLLNNIGLLRPLNDLRGERSNKKTLLDRINHKYSQSESQDWYTSIEIVNLKLESMSFKEMFHFFRDLNVYVSTQGSASYMSLFMLHPEATLVYTPMCYRKDLQCSDYNIRFHEALSNVRTISLIQHLDMIECVDPSHVSNQNDEEISSTNQSLEDEIVQGNKESHRKEKSKQTVEVRGLAVKQAPVTRAYYGTCHERIDPVKLFQLISQIVSED